jgi:glutaredoxin
MHKAIEKRQTLMVLYRDITVIKFNMKKIIFSLVFILSLFVNNSASAQNTVNLYLFYGQECPHCKKEKIFLDKLKEENKNINIYEFEIWHNRENAQKLATIAKEIGIEVTGVPLLIIGDETVSGYFDDQTTGKKIKEIIERHTLTGCEDRVANVIGKKEGPKDCSHDCETDNKECAHDCGCSVDFEKNDSSMPEKIAIPFVGEIETKNISLPLLTLLIAGVDGFNPCSMWVLLFLISLLLGMKNKKRMWILGLAFIISSGVVYFLFLSAWLNLFLFLGFLSWVKISIGLVALASGGYHLYDAWKNRDGGCHVTGSEKRRKIFLRLQTIVTENKFWLALGGIMLLAFAVNLVELVCSAGLPAVYTQVLALSNLALWQHYAYLVFYVLIFMLDDVVVFFIAMTTLQMKALSSRYTRYAGVIGGVAMLVIGLLLLFKPEWIMFG